ncbi:hypothetical protein [uncultured Cellulomonas sp.]|uniref:hypothetical protein n=1 Tax=uncultured Cellulomonas sp. TaxID=189682 RepID=UPI0028EA4778|nr:hypothetical protein [uncultured Cellulomonas sp.]
MFDARVLRVLIASPGDTGKVRTLLRELIWDWNSLHSESSGTVLMPAMWEHDATPEMGDRPQSIVNRQVVDRADILIGTFWTRLGSSTGEAASGTVEEIESFIAAGKRVLLYFSDEPVLPSSVDIKQYSALEAFKKSVRTRGLFDSYADENELWRKVTASLTRVVREDSGAAIPLDAAPSIVAAPGPASQLVASVQSEREISGFSKSGTPRYRSKHWLRVENRGTAAAEALTLRLIAGEADENEDLPQLYGADEVGRLAPGATIEFPLLMHMGTLRQWDVELRWLEDGQDRHERQTVRG